METDQLHKVNVDLRKYSKKNLGRKNGLSGANFSIKSFCHAKSQRLIKSLGQWTTTIHTSKRLWPFYYSPTTGILYRGYRDEWHDNAKYQFDEFERDDDDVFAFEPEVRNVELKYMPNDAVPVDIATAREG